MPHPAFHEITERRAILRMDDLLIGLDGERVIRSLRSDLAYPRECPEHHCQHLGTVTADEHDFDVFFSPDGILGHSLKVQFGPEPHEYSYWAIELPHQPRKWCAITVGRLVHDYLKKE